MRISVITIFPGYLDPLRESLLGKAIADGVIQLSVHELRDWTTDRHRTVDDSPYGGGPGMVMKPDVWGRALDDVAVQEPTLIVPTPAGKPFTQVVAAALATAPHLVFACGRYEGIDQRVITDAAQRMPVLELSIGDYVLAGGEVAAMVMIEAITRLIPGVLGNPDSAGEDSFSGGRAHQRRSRRRCRLSAGGVVAPHRGEPARPVFMIALRSGTMDRLPFAATIRARPAR
jgi:tRNA (guanine37-N1)-methyltransferase